MKKLLMIAFASLIFLAVYWTYHQGASTDVDTSAQGEVDTGMEPEEPADENQNPAESQTDDGQKALDGLPYLSETVKLDADGKWVVTNPDNLLVVVNKERNLAPDYEPADLAIPRVPFSFEEDLPKKYMRAEAARALEELFARAEQEGLTLVAVSGYRSYQTQRDIFLYNVQRKGSVEEAGKYSAQAGQSEHQTGLAMDVSTPSIHYQLEETFAETPEGKWIAEHAAEFGFIIRYPSGKESITGYAYEPWHLRYVGVDHARAIHERNITLEEYLTPAE